MELIIKILITFVSYSVYPFIKYKIILKKKNYEKKEINRTLIINSVIVAAIYILISYIIYKDNIQINFIPAIFYYYLNTLLFSNNSVKERKYSKIKINHKSINIMLIFLVVISIIINIILTINYGKILKKQKEIEKEYIEYKQLVDKTMCEFDNNYVQVGNKFYQTCKEGLRFKPIN